MEELVQIREVCTGMAAKLESREIVPDNTHVAQLWHAMGLLCHHIEQLNIRIAQNKGK